jgi:F0F1-type ATP synthase assembly protein I
LVRWVLGGQLGLTAVLAGVAGLFGGLTAAVSLAVGGLIGFLGNLAYVWRAMRPESDPARLLKGQVVAEFYKFAISVVLFAMVFATSKNVAAVLLFVGFGTTFVVHWLAMLRRNQEIGEAGRS